MKPPVMREFGGKLLAGVRGRISFVDDRTSEIWREFRSRENELRHRDGAESYGVRVYDHHYSFTDFDPGAEFEKWAGAAVTRPTEGFEALEIPEGKYAVFIHKGPAGEAPRTFDYIFGEWLPKSTFELDHRPHFEVLPECYNPFDPKAEEEVWIPIREI